MYRGSGKFREHIAYASAVGQRQAIVSFSNINSTSTLHSKERKTDYAPTD